jgi:mannose-6-phosphate isomerase-like protein (cupin superfamily)
LSELSVAPAARAYAVKAIDELPSIHHGVVKLAGAELGIESFGLQVLDFPGDFQDYPEHDHAADGQEEVYVVLEGSAEFDIGGERVPAPAGSMVWVAAQSRRKMYPGPDGVRVLAVGGCRGRAYERPEDFRL